MICWFQKVNPSVVSAARLWPRRRIHAVTSVVTTAILTFALLLAVCPRGFAQSFDQVIDQVQPRMAKIYGAGGVRGLESYQSGIVISSDGLVLTVWSYVLDVDPIIVVLDDGRKFDASLKGYDPRVEIAVLKIEANDLDHFNLDESVELKVGNRVLAFSNLFGVAAGDESFSVLHGSVSAVTKLDARRGAFQSTYSGRVYVVDAMTNNPGSAGGALTNAGGQLAGILGKELRSSQYNTWLNYAIPTGELRSSVEDILAGRWSPRVATDESRRPVDPLTLDVLGIVLIPDIVANTPPFVDRVMENSPADEQGMLADDLILFINDRVMRSCGDVRDELSFVERDREINVAFRRGDQIKTIVLRAK